MSKFFLFIVGIIIIVVAGFSYWNYSLSPVNASDTSQKVFVITQGEAGKAIGEDLEKQGLIRNAFTFNILLKQRGGGNKIQAGDFKLSPSMSADKVIETLQHGMLDVWIKLPEGQRAEEYAEIFKRSGLKNYSDEWIQTLHVNEGYLFPDTYLFPANSTAETVVTIMTDNFYKQVGTIGLSKTSPNLSRVVILASITDREANSAEDRKMVVGVLENRLKIGMALQIDPAIQYAVGYDTTEKTWWKNNLTVDDLAINSPFNLHKNVGLAPHPICNPGLSALSAAANPTASDYLFYVSDKSGKLHFAKTVDGHNANVKKYMEN